MTFIHPSSVNHRKRDDPAQGNSIYFEKQLYAFAEKRQNLSSGGQSSSASMNLVTTTRLDPMTYVLFGAYEIEVTERGLDCDGWLPVIGNVDALDDIQRLKTLMEGCMLRVFEGIINGRQKQRWRSNVPIMPREEGEYEDEDTGSRRDYSLTSEEVRELDLMTRDIVRVLNLYSEERVSTQSRHNSRPGTPMDSPAFASLRLPSVSGQRSGYSSAYNSRPNTRPSTPSRLSRNTRF